MCPAAGAQDGQPPGCTESSGTARQGHTLLSAAGRAKPRQQLPLCGNKGDNIYSVRSNETENGFNPFIITAQSPMPQMASGDGAGTKPSCSPRAACGMDTGPGVLAPSHAHRGLGDLPRSRRPEQVPRPSPTVGCLQLRQKGEGCPQQRQRAGSIWSQLLQGDVTRVLPGLVAARASVPRFARSRYLTAALAHEWGEARRPWGAAECCRCPPAPAALNFSPCPCCDSAERCWGRSTALPMCLSLQPTAHPQDFQINN